MTMSGVSHGSAVLGHYLNAAHNQRSPASGCVTLRVVMGMYGVSLAAQFRVAS